VVIAIRAVSEEALPYRLKGIRFGLMSPTDIRKIGIIEIKEPTAYDEGGIPLPGGVLDPRLGTTNPRQRCPTCGNTYAHCPGHFGRIELARPVIHIGYVRRIKDALNMTCPKCGRVVLPEPKRTQMIERARRFWDSHPIEKISDELARTTKEEVKKYRKKNSTCPHCGTQLEEVDVEEVFKFIVKKPEPRRMWPTEIRDRLEKIPDDDAMLLGFNPERARPEWTVLTVLLVPPPTVRPSIFLETGDRAEDDLTHILAELVKANQKLKSSIAMGSPQGVVENEWDLLQYWVAVYFRNPIGGLPPASQKGTRRPLKALFSRLEGKEGRMRKNLVGKRVDFSSRTVISPDPMLDIDEVGIPVEIAMTLTIPEYVNEANIERLKELVLRGPDKYPGANYIRKGGGSPISLKILRRRGLLEEAAEDLQVGDVVERHLMDGDYVIFNRQPSLHKLSIMGHRVKVLPGATFRLNPGTCVPYNADFDGDEMNVHAPQLAEARVEARELMSVVRNMLSPRTGGSIVGARQDYITALYLMTRKGAVFSREDACRILSRAGITELPEPAILSPVELWTGKQIFSALLPPDLYFTTISKVCGSAEECMDPHSPVDGYVMIRAGQLLSGVVDENVVGTLVKRRLTLTDVLIRDYGEEAAASFLNRLLKMTAKEMLRFAVTITLKEITLPEEAEEEFERLYEEAERAVGERAEEFAKRKKAARYYRTKEEMVRATREEQMLEFEIVRRLESVRGEVSNVVSKYLDPEAHAVIMAKSGARGSMDNLAQVCGAVGQQTVKRRVGFVLTSTRPTKGFSGRVMSYFRRGDVGLEARGFVKRGYARGLKPSEFVFHAMSGRESLVDKGRRTEDSGYFYRRVANALKDAYVEYDGTVRDGMGRILQFAFGGDGYDPIKLFKGHPVNVDRMIREMVRPKKRGISLKRIRKILADHGVTGDFAEEVASKLKKVGASEREVRAVAREVSRRLEEAKVEVLTPIGIISAQSIAEPTTQMVLRTFRAPGVLKMDVTHGVERFKELVFYISTSTPTMEIHLKGEWAKDPKKAEEAAKRIREVRVKHLLKRYKIVYTGPKAFHLVMEVDREVMEELGVTMEELASAVKAAVKGIKGKVEVVGEEALEVDLSEAAKRERPYQTLRAWSMRAVDRLVRGVEGIERAFVEKVEGKDEYIVRTVGSNFREILKKDFVDPTRTVTNNCAEVAEVLGIEAGRNCVLRELLRVLREQGLEVDKRYVTLIADAMSYPGKLLPIGLQASGVPSGFFALMKTTLSKMAFEWVYHVILGAARRGEENPIEAPLDALIMGQTPPVGTGRVSLRWDWRKARDVLAEV